MKLGLLLKNIFMEILNCVAPVKEVRLKERTEPWIIQDILENVKERDHLLCFIKSMEIRKTITIVCKMRNQVLKEIRIANSSFFANKIEESKNDSKGLWQHLKDLGYKGEKKGKSNNCFSTEMVIVMRLKTNCKLLQLIVYQYCISVG